MKNNPAPPRLFHRFFRWYCKPSLRDHIEGDLLELYQQQVKEKGKRKANSQFIIHVLQLLRPGIIRSLSLPSIHYVNQYGMFKSYFKTGWRRLARNKGYSFINIGGLAIGMTVAIFIGLWIYDELSFNKYHKNYKTIGQIWSGETDPQTQQTGGGYNVQQPVGATLRNNYPHFFKQVLMAWWIGDHTIIDGNNKFGRKGEFIEAGAPEMLSLKMLQGSYSCLEKPNSIILSQSTATAIFGNADPMNKTLTIDNKMEVQVTGVYEDIPRNNRFSEVEFFAPWSLYVSVNDWIRNNKNDWDNRPFNIYVQLQPNVSMDVANAAIKSLYYKNVPADLLSTMDKYKPFVQVVPMSTWHLYSEFENGKPATGRIVLVWLFGIIGIFVLLLACINFINLSTARSEKRAKEVGVRKTIGSGKTQLVLQFLSESFLIVLLAFIVSLGLVALCKNWFNQLADKEMELPYGMPVFWLMSLAFILFTGFMAGIYPAFYLSSFRPVKVLKGVVRTSHFSSLPRKILVVIQFTVSVVLIIGTLVVYKQVMFAQDRPAGYERSNLITVPVFDPAYEGKYDLLKTELLRTGTVSAVSASTTPLTTVNNFTTGYDWKDKPAGMDGEFGICRITHDFGKTIGWQIVAGRDFSDAFATDSADAIIINEAAARYMNLQKPVGEKLVDTDEHGVPKRTWTIIGVVKDLVMISPYEPARQTIFYYDKYMPWHLHIKMNPAAGTHAALEKIKQVFANVAPSALFQFKFIDEEYALKFSQEERTGKLSGVFAILAIFISCLGLSGLASFVAEQRTKEIGIRKVMGASVTRLWQMLSKDFIVLVIISCFIAIPVGYFLMDNWLQKYEYHTNISWWIFALTSLAAVVITMLTISYQSIKAAKLNPVKSLRAE